MPASLWISTAYLHQSPNSEKFVALLAFADNRDAFEQLVKATFDTQNTTYYSQLAALPAEIFFSTPRTSMVGAPSKRAKRGRSAGC